MDADPADQSTWLEVPHGIPPRSSLAPMGARLGLVEQRITWPAGEYPVREVMLSLSVTWKCLKTVFGGKPGPKTATHEASLADSRVWAIGQVDPFVLDGGVGRTRQQSWYDHPRLGPRGPGYKWHVFFLKSKTIRGPRDRIVTLGKGAFVPHTRVRLIRHFLFYTFHRDHHRR